MQSDDEHGFLSDNDAVSKSLLEKEFAMSIGSLPLERSMMRILDYDDAKDDDVSVVSTVDLHESDIDQESAIYQMTTPMRICLISAQYLIFAQLMGIWGLYLVIPFYVHSTPENGWTFTNLAIVFGLANAGAIVAAQIPMFAECFTDYRNITMFIGHLMQFIIGAIGIALMSPVRGFNLSQFYAGAFMVGFSSDITMIRAYGPLISDDEEFQMRTLRSLKTMGLTSCILCAVVLPVIYERAGFQAFCGTICAVYTLAVILVCTLWFQIVRGESEDDMSSGADESGIFICERYVACICRSRVAVPDTMTLFEKILNLFRPRCE